MTPHERIAAIIRGEGRAKRISEFDAMKAAEAILTERTLRLITKDYVEQSKS